MTHLMAPWQASTGSARAYSSAALRALRGDAARMRQSASGAPDSDRSACLISTRSRSRRCTRASRPLPADDPAVVEGLMVNMESDGLPGEAHEKFTGDGPAGQQSDWSVSHMSRD